MTSDITNENVKKLIEELRSKESKLFSRLACELEKSRRSREVNLSRISRYAKENETIVVPGKVLGGGTLTHKVNISAFKFSRSALSKIEKSGSKIIPIDELTKEPPKGIRIIG